MSDDRYPGVLVGDSCVTIRRRLWLWIFMLGDWLSRVARRRYAATFGEHGKDRFRAMLEFARRTKR